MNNNHKKLAIENECGYRDRADCNWDNKNDRCKHMKYNNDINCWYCNYKEVTIK